MASKEEKRFAGKLVGCLVENKRHIEGYQRLEVCMKPSV